MGVRVENLVFLDKLSLFFEPLDDCLVRILNEKPLVIRDFLGELAFRVNRLHVWHTASTENLVVVLTKARSNMYNASSVLGGNVVRVEHPECALLAFLAGNLRTHGGILQIRKIREQRLIFSTHKFLSFVAVDDFILIGILII